MRRILFALVALGALAWLAAPVSAAQYRGSRGNDSWGSRQSGQNHGGNHRRSSWRSYQRCGTVYRSHGRNDHRGDRYGNRGGSYGRRYQRRADVIGLVGEWFSSGTPLGQFVAERRVFRGRSRWQLTSRTLLPISARSPRCPTCLRSDWAKRFATGSSPCVMNVCFGGASGASHCSSSLRPACPLRPLTCAIAARTGTSCAVNAQEPRAVFENPPARSLRPDSRRAARCSADRAGVASGDAGSARRSSCRSTK